MVYSVLKAEQLAACSERRPIFSPDPKAKSSTTLNPGKHLRSIREHLRLKFRDVEEASRLIAVRHRNPEFLVGLSRLADIENKGTVPSIYRLYSLAVVYGIDISQLLSSYGISLANIAQDIAQMQLEMTRPVGVYAPSDGTVELPQGLASSLDFKRTGFLTRQIRAWGLIPLHFLTAMGIKNHRYALVGTEDWSMYPLIPPGSFIQIDETKRKVINSGWDNDYSRPIYFLELRDGYRFGWCTERSGTLIVQPHSSAPVPAEVFKHPGEVEVLGQVVGVAMRLDRAKPRRKHSS